MQSGRPKAALRWLHEVEDATQMCDLFESGSFERKSWESLDFKLTTAPHKIIAEDLKRQVAELQEKTFKTYAIQGAARQVAAIEACNAFLLH